MELAEDGQGRFVFGNDFNHLKEDADNFDDNSVIILFYGKDYIEPFYNMIKSMMF